MWRSHARVEMDRLLTEVETPAGSHGERVQEREREGLASGRRERGRHQAEQGWV